MIAVSLNKNNVFRAKPHSVLRPIVVGSWAWHFGAILDNITAGNLLAFSRFLVLGGGFAWFP